MKALGYQPVIVILPCLPACLQRKLQEAQDGLHRAANSHSEQHASLAVRLRDAGAALAAAQADGSAQRERAAVLQSRVADQEQGLAEQAGCVEQLQRERAQLEAGNASLQEQLAAAQRRGRELAEQQQQLQERAAAGRQQLEGRLATEVEARQRAEAATAAAREALADEEKRHALDSAAWERRLRELQQDAGERLIAKEAAWATQRETLQREAASAQEETRRQLTKRLYLTEGEWARKLQQTAADWGA